MLRGEQTGNNFCANLQMRVPRGRAPERAEGGPFDELELRPATKRNRVRSGVEQRRAAGLETANPGLDR